MTRRQLMLFIALLFVFWVSLTELDSPQAPNQSVRPKMLTDSVQPDRVYRLLATVRDSLDQSKNVFLLYDAELNGLIVLKYPAVACDTVLRMWPQTLRLKLGFGFDSSGRKSFGYRVQLNPNGPIQVIPMPYPLEPDDRPPLAAPKMNTAYLGGIADSRRSDG